MTTPLTNDYAVTSAGYSEDIITFSNEEPLSGGTDIDFTNGFTSASINTSLVDTICVS